MVYRAKSYMLYTLRRALIYDGATTIVFKCAEIPFVHRTYELYSLKH